MGDCGALKPYLELKKYAYTHPVYGNPVPTEGGFFQMGKLRIMASWAERWDHVSVSRRDRMPTWDEMEKVKREFFKDTETAMQLHVPPTHHINVHPNCLHLWRPHYVEIPRPPSWMVG